MSLNSKRPEDSIDLFLRTQKHNEEREREREFFNLD